MPAYRNVGSNRSGHIVASHTLAIERDKDSWQIPVSETNGRVEHLDAPYTLSCPPSSSSCSPSSDAASLPSVSSQKTSRTRHRRGDPNHVRRPPNAFIIFRSEYVKSGLGNAQGQTDLSRDAAKVWNRMSDDQKQPFCQMAIAEKEEHLKLYPDYVYAPNFSGGKGRGKGKSKSKVPANEEGEGGRSRPLATSSKSLLPNLSRLKPPRRSIKSRRLPSQCVSQMDMFSVLDMPCVGSFHTVYDHSSPASSSEGQGVPTTDIPDLGLSSIKEEKQFERAPDFALEPSPSHAHLDSVPEQFGFHQYQCHFTEPALPPIPHTTYNLKPVVELPQYDARSATVPHDVLPFTLLPGELDLRAEYLASQLDTPISAYSLLYRDDMPLQQSIDQVLQLQYLYLELMSARTGDSYSNFDLDPGMQQPEFNGPFYIYN